MIGGLNCTSHCAGTVIGLSGCRCQGKSRCAWTASRAGLFLDVLCGSRSTIDNPFVVGCLRHELAVLAAERFTQTDRGVATKVRQSFPFFFAHVVVVGQSGPAERGPPLVGGCCSGVCVAHAVTNVVVITDRIERFALGVVGAPWSSCG